MTQLIVGFDSAWNGTGWAICTEHGPIYSGHVRAGTWRIAGLLAALHQIELLLVDERIAHGGVAPRVVIERLPWSYRRMGSQVRTVYGISGCAHVIAAWGCRPDWAYPWLHPPRDDRKRGRSSKPLEPDPGWRQWWQIRGKRPVAKRAAIDIVTKAGWGRHLEDRPDIDKDGNGARGDVAEAILIGVGAARHPEQHPKGPRRWPDGSNVRATLSPRPRDAQGRRP